LRSKIGSAPVWAVVVLWSGARRQDRVTRVDASDVVVLHGSEVLAWLAARDGMALDSMQIDGAWEWLAGQVHQRDLAELERDGPPPRSIEDLLVGVAHYSVGAAAGFVATSALVTSRRPLVYVAGIAALAVAGIAALRWKTTRRGARGWLFGIAITVVIVAAVFVGVAAAGVDV
jgi:hypothetical protein